MNSVWKMAGVAADPNSGWARKKIYMVSEDKKAVKRDDKIKTFLLFEKI